MGSYLRPIAVVFTNPQLRRLQLAWATSTLGTCAYLIALAVVAFRSGGATAVGLIMLVRTLAAAAVASPPLSALADRYPRRSVMAISDLIRAVLTAAIALLVETQAPIIAVYALTVGISIVGTPFRPAQAALTPKLAATPVELTASNAVAGTLESASIFLGPGIGGIILAVSGTAGVFVVCVAAFLWSACSRLVDQRAAGRTGGRGRRGRRDPERDAGRLPDARGNAARCSRSPSRTPPRRWSPAP